MADSVAAAAATLRELISRRRADRVPQSTWDQPFPPIAVMEPIRRAERLVKPIEDVASSVCGLPLLNSDKVWDRVRKVGLDELMQFDWSLGLAAIREVMADRQRYCEIS